MPDSVPQDALEGFEVSEVLNQEPLNKSITLLGTFSGRAGPAIVQLTRRPFDAERAQATVGRATCREKQFENDVYSKVSRKCSMKMAHKRRISESAASPVAWRMRNELIDPTDLPDAVVVNWM